MKLIVYTYNPIPVGGFIQLSWPETVVFYQSTECTFETNELTKENTCKIDHDAKTISITGAFTETPYVGPLHITLSLLTNPITNKDMKSFTFTSYDDPSMQYPIDRLEFVSLLECFFTCRYCGAEKDYCTECWPGDENIFLQRLGKTSTCQPQCNSGYTSNGSIDFTCTLCDTSCLECADNGNLGDVEVCTKCADNFNFLDIATSSCMAQCPTGSYDKGDGTCGLCDATCGLCETDPLNCISCNTDSIYPVLY